MAPAPDQAAITKIVATILTEDRARPGTAAAIIAELARRLGPSIFKPPPRSSDDVDPGSLIG